jgi:uncharacterized protein YutE (UPF0331/DUF86 family)
VRDVFALPAIGGWIDNGLVEAPKHMVGYRNIAVHGYQALHLLIAVAVITRHLDEFLDYSRCSLLKDAQQG